MKAVAYAFEAAASVDAATSVLRDGGWGFKPVAGGQSLGAMLNLRLAQPETLVDLDGISELRDVKEAADHVFFGAMTTHAAIEDGHVPDPSGGLMPFVARSIAYRAVRNRGTIGGSLCHADPAADWVACLPLLGATVAVAGEAGRRDIPAASFMTSAFETQLTDGELLLGVRVPRRSPAARWSYRKFCRKTGEFSHATVGALIDPADGTERLVLGALDGAPRVFEGAGLLHDLTADMTRRQALLDDAGQGLDDTRRALLAEMLRLALNDMETPR
ncbi:FAD binding domain-containing protein [Variovorax arabinosiphilus]|uniref:FAD binding domain-containing protein n=1 Tax=Variovorax arabinosiphilus TaxID=3053498 RepID=UPI002575FE20|nr:MULTISPECIES: FAD binding domain-containing protein [unclassified Variovorax]MDM0119614.1 FAD binding domain-containing protein [Variovorax sp. J2L1-78]MDM0128474.1 FAD binding domain-containing protein [Variovorax sp. J2L1-63]MDM0232174.1 FAD binding domain-containing protein [Variovorax sp. J2R1-6]